MDRSPECPLPICCNETKSWIFLSSLKLHNHAQAFSIMLIIMSWHVHYFGCPSMKSLSHVLDADFNYRKESVTLVRQLFDPIPESGCGWLILLIRIAIAFHWLAAGVSSLSQYLQLLIGKAISFIGSGRAHCICTRAVVIPYTFTSQHDEQLSHRLCMSLSIPLSLVSRCLPCVRLSLSLRRGERKSWHSLLL
jgi:hypothetical protein